MHLSYMYVHVCMCMCTHAQTQSEQELGEVDALVGSTKGMTLHKPHMKQSQHQGTRQGILK